MHHSNVVAMIRVRLRPISTELWQVEDGEAFSALLRRTLRMEQTGDWAKACELRFDCAQQLLDAVGDEPVRLDWNDVGSRAAMEILYRSAADNMMVGEVEMAVALWESLLDVDPEDHLEAVVPLAFAYVEIEDYECLESAMFDISPKSAEYQLLLLWSEYRRSGGIDKDALRQLRTRHNLQSRHRQTPAARLPPNDPPHPSPTDSPTRQQPSQPH